MASYSSLDLYNTFKHYADHLEAKINEFNRVDSLPLVATKRELAARKKAAEILLPVHQMFKMAAEQYKIECAREMPVHDMYPTEQLSSYE